MPAGMCEKLGINELLVPPGAGVGSAIGFLTAPFGYETVRSSHRRLGDLDHAWLNDLLSEMKRKPRRSLRAGGGDAKLHYRARAFMRYTGQGWEIPVDIVDMKFGRRLLQLNCGPCSRPPMSACSAGSSRGSRSKS